VTHVLPRQLKPHSMALPGVNSRTGLNKADVENTGWQTNRTVKNLFRLEEVFLK